MKLYMKKLMMSLLPLMVMIHVPFGIYAQSAITNVISFDMDDVNELFMPPDLKVNMEFVDDNQSGVLEAMENATLRLKIINEGGTADNVRINLVPEKSYRGISYPLKTEPITVKKNAAVEVDVPFSADVDVATSKDVRFHIRIQEPNGYDIKAVLEFPTLEYQKAALRMNGVSIVDAGKGLQANNGNPDGKLQRGDVVRATVLLQNVGVGVARNVTYSISSDDSNVKLLTDTGYSTKISGSVSDMASSDAREISFRLSANHNYVNNSEYLPIYLTVKEDKGFGNIVSQIIPIPFDATPVKPEVVTVEGDLEKILADLGRGRITSEDGRVNSTNATSSIRDIKIAPVGESIYQDAVAIVIGAEKYADNTIPRAPYAARDAEVMSEYFKTSLGIEKVHLMTDEKVTAMELNTMFDAQRGKLSRWIKPGQTDVFIYYSGHGVPQPDGNDVMLVPYDVEKAWINDYSFSLNKMYENLASLNAKSVTVILDACFSGGSRPSELYKSESVANQKLVKLKDLNTAKKPWLDNPDFRVFTSSRGDQTSLGNDLSRSGLFTYYIACGLQGDADKNADKKITMDELVEFVTVGVNNESAGTQTPQFFGNKNFVVEKF